MSLATAGLTSTDEEDTHVRLKEHLRVLIDPKISEYRGRVVKNTGDGMLAEFNSVVAPTRSRRSKWIRRQRDAAVIVQRWPRGVSMAMTVSTSRSGVSATAVPEWFG
jgi:class 3 adenylate cyclase